MADAQDLLTLAEGYTALNDNANAVDAGGGLDGTRDVEMARWITGVSRRIDSLCGPVVQRTVTDEAHDGGVSRLWLRETPVLSVTSVKEYDDTTLTTLTAETNSVKPDDGYILVDDKHNVQLIRRSGNHDWLYSVGRRNVLVTYEAGRFADTASVDEDFKTAAGASLRRLFHREGGAWAMSGNPFDVSGQGGPGFFKIIDPVVHEFLHDEILPPAVA